MMEKLDLHLHSTVSDGTDTPEELLDRARAVGLDLFALTDHDAIQGCARVLALRRPGDPAFLSGVEFNARDGAGKYHILGYGCRPDAEAILRVVETGHRYRMQKLLARLDFLETRYGFAFSPEDRAGLLALDNPGKPHIGNLMVKLGYAPTKEVAIRGYIDSFHIPDAYVTPREVLEGILASGGIPVLAHPCFGSGDELILGDALETRVRRLMDLGLQGLEGYYSGFSEKLREEVLALAARYELYITAGSDYHGRNKLVRLADTGLGPPATWPQGLHRFLSRWQDAGGRL